MTALLAFIAKLLAGPLFDYLKSRDATQLSREALEAEIEKALIAQQQAIAGEQAKIILAETGGNWLQRGWRPTVALVSFFSYWFVIVGYPFTVAWGVLPYVRFGEAGLQNLFWLTSISVGGYIASRGVEKVMGRA